MVAGAIQIVLGFMRAGIFAYYFPSSVIKGMLAAIGIILIIKQVPHAVGFDRDFEGDLSVLGNAGSSSWFDVSAALSHINPGAVVVSALGLLILVVWGRSDFLKRLKWLPAPLAVVVLGIGMNALFLGFMPQWAMQGAHLVSLPSGGISDLLAQMRFPDFGRITEAAVWQTGFVIAAVASIETLLCIEAVDKLDPYKRSSPTNRELIAQGMGNMVTGLLGGLPLTAVIVRGSANIQSGGRTRMSAFLHGVLLLVAIVALPAVMNMIPLAALAAILLHIGYKLARVEVFRAMFRQESGQWVPFAVTIVSVVAIDLLSGVGIGMGVAVFFILRANLQTPYFIHHRESHEESDHRIHINIELSENVSFLNKASVNKVLHELPADSVVTIDGTRSHYVHSDVIELIHEFASTAHTRGVDVTLEGIRGPKSEAPKARPRPVAITREPAPS